MKFQPLTGDFIIKMNPAQVLSCKFCKYLHGRPPGDSFCSFTIAKTYLPQILESIVDSSFQGHLPVNDK